ncbi:MAG: aminotransferase class V-fold PLP-dependent enzyme [Bacteroidota bacterium]
MAAVRYTFNPGPAMVYPQVRQFLQDAYDEQILSISHRSTAFEQIYRTLDANLRVKLGIPADYSIFTLSSATEVWSVLSESLVESKSTHLYTGAFGERWFQRARHITPGAVGFQRSVDHDWAAENWRAHRHTELLCLTQNETATTAQVPPEVLPLIRKTLPDTLIAIDGTSSLAGVNLPIAQADIWYASVQKCFGLPAGLSVLIVSPRVIEKAEAVGFIGQYNALLHIAKRYEKFQNTHTPNVLGKYLLSRLSETLPAIGEIHDHVAARMQRLIHFFEQEMGWELVVEKPQNRSLTVLGVRFPEEKLAELKSYLFEQHGLQLGSGYGPLKPDSFRVANFPAIPDAAFDALFEAMRNYQTSRTA